MKLYKIQAKNQKRNYEEILFVTGDSLSDIIDLVIKKMTGEYEYEKDIDILSTEFLASEADGNFLIKT